MRVLNISESKAAFKKEFGNDCNGTFSITINPAKKTIRFATIDKFSTLRELYIPIEHEDLNTKKVIISSVDKLDVIWNFIWNKDGFWVNTYKNACKDLDIVGKSNGNTYTMAEIVFNTKKKRYIYKTFECDSIQAII